MPELDIFVAGSNGTGVLGLLHTDDVHEWTTAPQISAVPGCTTLQTSGVHCGLLHAGHVLLWGDNRDQQCSDSGAPHVLLSEAEPLPWPEARGLALGWTHSVVWDAGGRLWARGRGSHAQLGRAGAARLPTWTEVQPPAGCGHIQHAACALFRLFVVDSAGVVWQSTPARRRLRLRPAGADAAAGPPAHEPASWAQVMARCPSPAVQLAAGWHHGLALLADGRVLAWSAKNAHGEVGVVTPPGGNPPIHTEMLDAPVAQVVCGANSSYARCTDGAVYACGRNDMGQLGLGHTRAVPCWTRIPAPAAHSIAAGTHHILILDQAGTVWGAGWDEHGNLGLAGTAAARPALLPVHPSAGRRCTRVLAGGAMSMLYYTSCEE